MLELKRPLKNEMVSLQTDEQKAFIVAEKERAEMDGALSFKWYDLEKQGTDHSHPLPVTFCWNEIKEDADKNEGYYYLLLSEHMNMQDPWVYITKHNYYDVYNLKADTMYFWCVQKNGKRSEVFSFQTLLTLPRCIKIDDVSNVRDMGGYKVLEGRIRQGLVYRGGEFELHMHLSDDGAKELQRLKIRTELDMRGEARKRVDFTTPEAIGIKRVYVPSNPYAEVFDEEKSSALNHFFKTFADPANYPIYYHCFGGADRTGTFAFLLGAFLGMDLDYLILEYEFTSLSIWGIRTRNYVEFQRFLEQFMLIHGETLQQKGETFLKKYADLTDSEIADIYDILIEKN